MGRLGGATGMTPKAIGIDIGGTDIKAALFGGDGSLIRKLTRPTPLKATGIVPAFANKVLEMADEMGGRELPLGIAAPGLAARDGCSIAFLPDKLPGIEHLDWTAFLNRGRHVPVLNDAHAALLGEVWYGAARGCQHAVMITLGTGVGGAILSDGRLIKGTIGRAGHVGHISISDNAKQSITGTPGALELEIGNYTISKRSDARFSSTLDLIAAHRRGDADATSIWMKSIGGLARSITSLINLLDPEIIIIGGGIARAGEDLFTTLAFMLDKMEWRPAGHRVRIVPAQLGEWAGACGAAWNAINL